jgi:hypothetical protein
MGAGDENENRDCRSGGRWRNGPSRQALSIATPGRGRHVFIKGGRSMKLTKIRVRPSPHEGGNDRGQGAVLNGPASAGATPRPSLGHSGGRERGDRESRAPSPKVRGQFPKLAECGERWGAISKRLRRQVYESGFSTQWRALFRGNRHKRPPTNMKRNFRPFPRRADPKVSDVLRPRL